MKKKSMMRLLMEPIIQAEWVPQSNLLAEPLTLKIMISSHFIPRVRIARGCNLQINKNLTPSKKMHRLQISKIKI